MNSSREFAPVKRASHKSAFLEDDDSLDQEPASGHHHHHDGRRCNHDHSEELDPQLRSRPAAAQQVRPGREDREREFEAEQEKVLQRLRHEDVGVSWSTSLVSLAYPVLTVLLAYAAQAYQEALVSDEMYVKFHDNLERYNRQTELSGPLVLAEFIKFFSVCAYDVLVVMYLIKPLRTASSDVRRAHAGKETREAAGRSLRAAQGGPQPAAGLGRAAGAGVAAREAVRAEE